MSVAASRPRLASLPALLTVREAARMLGVTEEDVRARIEAGSLRSVWAVGTGVRVPAAELNRVMADSDRDGI